MSKILTEFIHRLAGEDCQLILMTVAIILRTSSDAKQRRHGWLGPASVTEQRSWHVNAWLACERSSIKMC